MKLAVSVIILYGILKLFPGTQLFAAEETSEEDTVKPVKPLEPLGLRQDRLLASQLLDGEAKWLKAGKTEFLGIFNAVYRPSLLAFHTLSVFTLYFLSSFFVF